MANETRWCFAWFKTPTMSEGGAARAALAKNAKWEAGDDISFAFLDGDSTVQDRVEAAARGWIGPGRARLKFSRLDDPNGALIRISFRHPGSWSVIGTTCRQVPTNQATMNFGWLTRDSTDEAVRGVVLHEFGHAIGLIHEHQNPAGGIQWNREAVIRDLSGPPNNWPLDVIEHNMFEPHDRKETNYTELDPQSIMMYPFPASWTVNGFSTDVNSTLSERDRSFIRTQYA